MDIVHTYTPYGDTVVSHTLAFLIRSATLTAQHYHVGERRNQSEYLLQYAHSVTQRLDRRT